jgi:hypothetical protein
MTAKYGEVIIGHNQEIEDDIFRMYRQSVKNRGCKECTNYFATNPNDVHPLVNESRPLSFFVVGSDFRNEKYKVMFVGKTVQDGLGQE